jgi:DNA polymerase III alpha subunit
LLADAKNKMLRAKVVDTRTGQVIDAGNFKLDKDFDRRYIDYETRNAQERKRIIDNTKSSLINSGTPKNIVNLYSNEQLLRIGASKQISSPTSIQGQLKIIDNRTDLNIFQKEQAKRELLGMRTNRLGEQKGFTSTIIENRQKKINEIKKSLNSIQQGDTTKPLSFSYLNKIEDYLTKKYNNIINKPAEKRTKKDKNMASVIIEDKTGRTEIAIFPKMWDKLKNVLKTGEVYEMCMIVEKQNLDESEDNIVKIFASGAERLQHAILPSSVLVNVGDATIVFMDGSTSQHNMNLINQIIKEAFQ